MQVSTKQRVPSSLRLLGIVVVARVGIEPTTFRFSGGRSYQLSYLAGRYRLTMNRNLWRP